MAWLSEITDLLWRSAWAVVPVALAATAVCRWLPCRPVTRHALWVVVLGSFLAPLLAPMIPGDGLLPAPDGSEGRSAESASETPTGTSTLAFAFKPLSAAPARTSDLSKANDLAGRDSIAYLPNRSGEDVHAAGWPGLSPRVFAPHVRARSSRAGRGAPPNRAVTGGENARTATLPPSRESNRDASGSTGDYKGGKTPPYTWQSRVKQKPVLRFDQRTVSSTLRGDRAGLSRPRAPTSADASPAGTAWRIWLLALAGVRDALLRLPTLPVGFWLGGISAVLTAYLGGVVWYGWRLRKARPAPKSVERMVSEIARRLGLRRPPETVMVDDGISPLVWCGRRARLILPAALWSQLDRVGHQAILCHELAHLRRRDHWVRWFELLISVLFWWHPLMWWVRRRVDEEADLCCDAWVTWLMPHKRRAYAEALLKARQFAGKGRRVAPAMAMGVTTVGAKRFARRLTMVMTHNARPRISIAGVGLACILAFAGWIATPAWSCPPKTCDEASPEPPAPAAAPRPPTGVTGDASVLLLPPAPEPPKDVWYSPGPVGLFPGPGGDEPMVLLGGTLGEPDEGYEEAARRLAELDKELARLSAQVRALSAQIHAGRRLTPSQPPRLGWTGLAQGYGVGELLVRSYELPQGKLEELTKLMVREDVPIRVRPLENGIEVHATEAQHRIFAAFVGLLDGKETWREYELPEGKLEALSALMIRDDVPIFVRPEKGHLEARVTDAQHAVLEAFVELIHPTGKDLRALFSALGPAAHALSRFKSGVSAGAVESEAHKEALKQYEQARVLAETARARAAENAEQARAASEALAESFRAQARAQRHLDEVNRLKEQTRALMRDAEALERDAEELERRAEQLREKADTVQDADPERSKKLEQEARELERKARSLERAAAKLERQAEKLEEQARELESSD